MCSTQTKPSHSRQSIYPIVVLGCITHALAFPFTIWFGGGLAGASWAGIELVLSAIGLTWPLWVFPLWRCRNGRMSRVIVPLVCGSVAFCVGFFFMLMLIALNGMH